MKLLNVTLQLFLVTLLLSSCATIVGGSRYNARIMVVGNSKAKIFHQGQVKGSGTAFIKVKRSDADKFSFSVKEDGCDEKKFNYSSRTFRGWAFAGTILGWSGTITGVPFPIPFGAVVDLATGAVWKPDTNENGISKVNYKNFDYVVNYENCKTINNSDAVIDIVYLKNGSILRGLIVEQIPSVQIKMQTLDGNIFVFKVEEIEKMTREDLK